MRVTTGKIVTIGVAVLALAALVTTAFLGFRYWDERSAEKARESSLESARSYATTMFGYTPNNVEDHIAKSKSVLTGNALPTYNDLVTKSNLAAEVRKQGVVSEVTLQDAGVVRSTRDTATVLIFMNQSVTRGDRELVRVDPSRLTFSMERKDSRWMINAIDVITDDSFRSLLEKSDKPPSGGVPLNPKPGAPAPSAPIPVPTPSG